MSRSWEISRRACLRGAAGTLIGLPMLEAMVPGRKRALAAGEPPPVRLLFYLFTGGTSETMGLATTEGLPGCLRPKATGAGFETTPMLQPLADRGLKQDILVISNLHNLIAYPGPGPSAGGDHQRSECAILTGVDPQYSDGPNTTAGISADQVAANYLKQFTPTLPSLFVSNEPNGNDLTCWSSPTTRLSPIKRPSQAFRQLFGETGADSATLKKRLAQTTSVLHYAKTSVDRLRKKLGKADQETVDKYLTSVRDLEERIAAVGTAGGACAPGFEPKDDMPIPEHWKQMMDIVALAFQCDRTRVAVAHFYSHGLWFRWLDPGYDVYSDWHNDIEHSGGAAQDGFADADIRMQTYLKGSAWQIDQFGYLMRKLKDMVEPDGGSVLDNTVGVCTSEFAYGNGHVMYNLPVIVAGKGRGAVTPGRHIEVRKQPVAGLWVSMLNAAGVKLSRFGNSEGAVSLT